MDIPMTLEQAIEYCNEQATDPFYAQLFIWLSELKAMKTNQTCIYYKHGTTDDTNQTSYERSEFTAIESYI
jgi:hypothetical protein